MELAIRLKENRNRIGLSQEEMADRIYVSRQTISNWETDRTYPDVQSLLLLSELFETSIDELVKGDVEIMEKPTISAAIPTPVSPQPATARRLIVFQSFSIAFSMISTSPLYKDGQWYDF